MNRRSYRPPKVLIFFVLKCWFQICKNHYCRPKGSGDIAFQSKVEFSSVRKKRVNTFVAYSRVWNNNYKQSKKTLFCLSLTIFACFSEMQLVDFLSKKILALWLAYQKGLRNIFSKQFQNSFFFQIFFKPFRKMV